MTKVNILHIIDKLSMDSENPSSCTKLIADWIIHLDSKRFDAKVVSLQRDGGGKFLQEKEISIFYIEKGKISPSIINEIIKIIEQNKTNLVHLHGYASANFGRIAARKVGIHNIVHEHAILDILPHQFIADFLLRNKTDVAVAVSKAVKVFLNKGRSVPENKIKVIWNGIKNKKFQNIELERIEKIKNDVGIHNCQKVVGTLTRFREEKGTQYLIEAAEKVIKTEPNAKFVIAGDGPLKDELIQLAHNLNLNQQLTFPGFVEDVPALLQALDIVVMPSLNEGAPLALLEYMAAKKPIVATNVGGIKEVIENNISGLLVPSKEKESLAEAIVLLLKNESKAMLLAENAFKTSEKYSIENNVKSLENLYIDLVLNGK